MTASIKAEHLQPELESLFFKYYEVKPPYYVPPPPFSFDPSVGPPEVVGEPTIEEKQERETYRGWLDVERRARLIKMMEEGEELAQQHSMRVREKEQRELERLLGFPQDAEHWAKLSAELEVRHRRWPTMVELTSLPRSPWMVRLIESWSPVLGLFRHSLASAPFRCGAIGAVRRASVCRLQLFGHGWQQFSRAILPAE